MTPELYFIYDSHCPWSYAGSALVNALAEAFPEISIHAWHCAHFDGSDCAGHQQVDAVAKHSVAKFGLPYIRFADSPKNSVLAANLMAWLHNKHPEKVLEVLNALQKAHFIEGNALASKHDFTALIAQLKLSPPNKVFRHELSEEAEYILADIAELQEFIGTTAFPALLLSVGERAVLLDHSLYLAKPEKLVDAVKKELN